MPTQNITPENIQDYELVDEQIVNVETGEVVTNIHDVQFFLKYDQEKTKTVRMFKNNWRNKEQFIKLYQKQLPVVSLDAMGLFYFLILHAAPVTNEVLINKTPPTNEYFEKFFQTGKRKIIYLLDELEEKKMIVRDNMMKGRKIYVNPDYAFNGRNLSYSTYLSFAIDTVLRKEGNEP